MDDLIAKIKDRIQLKEGTAAIESVLGFLYFRQPVSTKELARNSLLPIPVVTAMKKECIKLGMVEQKNGVVLTKAGTRYLEGRFGYGGLREEIYFRLLTDGGQPKPLPADWRGSFTMSMKGGRRRM
jgi:predicted methyltransferase